MKNYKVKTKVSKNFNDTKDNNKPYEVGEPIILDRARYEELFAKGFVRNTDFNEWTAIGPGTTLSISSCAGATIEILTYAPISTTIKKARDKVQMQLEECLYRLGNNSGVIFNLKNNFDWKDKIEHSSSEVENINKNISNIANLLNNPKPNRSEEDV